MFSISYEFWRFDCLRFEIRNMRTIWTCSHFVRQTLQARNAMFMKNVLAVICIAVLCITLTLGLWPFHAPNNDVVWLRNQDGLHFGPYGSAISSGTFQAVSNSEVSLEIWFRPKRIWDSGTFMAFYGPRNLFQFSLRQSQTTLLVKATPNGDRYHARTLVLYIDEALHRSNRPVFLSITAGDQGTSVYLDGRLAKATQNFRSPLKT